MAPLHGESRKQSLYFPEDLLNEIQVEANRQDRSLSWIVQQAWRIARGKVARFPGKVVAEPAPIHPVPPHLNSFGG